MKKYLVVLVIVIVGASGFYFYRIMHDHSKSLTPVTNEQGQTLYYTCSMHPSVKVTPKDYKAGNTSCPICSMPLIPIEKPKEEHSSHKKEDKVENSNKPTMISLSKQDVILADIRTSKASYKKVYKEIRTVGQVAYDPNLVVAQEEFVAAINSLSEKSPVDVKERSEKLIESAKRKLLLLGMSKDQIEELELTKQVDRSLILPEKQLWVYGDLFESNRVWVKEGQMVVIESEVIPGKTFKGKVIAIDPVIKERTRTFRARILIKGQDISYLQPKSYVDVFVKSSLGKKLTVSKSAVLNTGERKIVYMAHGNNKYMAKEVSIGPESIIYHNNHKMKVYPILKGLKSGDIVVTKGNFLIDSQRQIGAAASAYGGSLGEGESVPGSHNH